MRNFHLLGCASLLLLVTFACANGQSHSKRDALRGIARMKVVIESLGAEKQAGGLSVEQLQADVELRLRKAGLRVLDESTDDVAPFLVVEVNAIKGDIGSFYAVNMSVEFYRWTTFGSGKDMLVTAVPVWSKEILGLLPTESFATKTRQVVTDLSDQFINDSRTASTSTLAAKVEQSEDVRLLNAAQLLHALRRSVILVGRTDNQACLVQISQLRICFGNGTASAPDCSLMATSLMIRILARSIPIALSRTYQLAL